MTTFDRARPLRQSMNWLHTWSGLLLGWLLFAIFVTGTLSYFRNEITFWMQPELHRAQTAPPERIAFVRALALLAREAPDAQQWTLTLPNPRNPTLGLGWQSSMAGNRQASSNATREQDAGGAQPSNPAAESRPVSGETARGRPDRGEARGENGARREGRRRERGADGAQLPNPAAESRPVSGETTRGRPNRGEARSESGARPPGAERQPEAGPQRSGAGAQRQGQGGGGHRGPRLVLDPASGEKLEGRATAGGNFLYRFHFELYGIDRIWARWIVGIATMLMFVALVSGVIVHRRIFKDFFTFRPGKGKRSWLDAHNASSVLSLPFHLIITFSGLVLFGNMLMPTALQAAYRGDSEAHFGEMRARMTPSSGMPEPSGERAPLMTGLAALIAEAQDTWGGERVGSITITHPGDRNAVIELRQMGFPSLTGGRNVPALRFNGVTGEPLAAPAAREQSVVQAVGSVLNLLHRGFFATPVPRWLLFLSGVGGSLMIASGLVMWTVSRARKAPEPMRAPWGHRLVEVLNIAAVAGLMAAIAVHFWANRLIPADLPARADWEIHAFFIAWAVTLVHAALRRPKAAWVEQLACAGALTALLPLVNAATGGLALPGSIERGLGLLAGFDLCALISGAGMLYAAYKVHRHTPRARLAASPSREEPSSGPETEADTLLPGTMEEAA
ncbi:MAG: PepSY domain-containing protein [Azoarcus sp.]|nr:PepSY domain-containing protein [Azoarcus sp.]